MLSNTQIRRLKSYQQKKFRKQEGVFIAETPKVAEVLLLGKLRIKEIYALPSWTEKPANRSLTARCERRQGQKIGLTEITEKELERISALIAPQEVFILVEYPEKKPYLTPDLYQGCSLVLDDIRDPGNLGTIIRIADWFGIEHVLCTEDCADAYQPKCVQASMGSVGICDIRYLPRETMVSAIGSEKEGLQVFGTFMEGENLYESRLPQEKAWYIIGNEGRGIGPDLAGKIEKRLSIPPSPKHSPTGAESLNAAIATAILCAEIRRRQTV